MENIKTAADTLGRHKCIEKAIKAFFTSVKMQKAFLAGATSLYKSLFC